MGKVPGSKPRLPEDRSLPAHLGIGGGYPQQEMSASSADDPATQQGDPPPLTKDQARERDAKFGPNIEGIHTVGFGRR